MKTLFLYLIFTLWLFAASNSQTFEAIFDINAIVKPIWSVECHDGYLVSVTEKETENSPCHARILKINYSGEVINQLKLDQHYEDAIWNILELGKNKYVCMGYYFETETANAFGNFLYFDENLVNQKEVIFQTKAEYGDIITISSLLDSQNQIISILATHQDLGLKLMYWNMLNNLGDIVLSNMIEKEKTLNITSCIIENFDKTGFYVFSFSLVYNFNDEFQQIDSFNIMKDQILPYYSAKWKSEYIYIGGQWSNDSKQNNSITKFDNHFNFVKHYQLNSKNWVDYPALYNSMDIFGNNFYLCGTYDFKFGPTFSNYKNGIRLVCFDEELKPKWDKIYGGQAYHFAYHTLATSDGGCLISATRYDFSQPEQKLDLYLLKVDSLGNYTPLAVEEDKLTANKVSIYPNPGTSELNVSISNGGQVAVFTLYSIAGQKVLTKIIECEQTQIATGQLPNGLYVYELSQNRLVLDRGKWVKQ